MRVFVTGGTGLIGQRLIPRLRERGDQVVVLTRNAVSARTKLGDQAEFVEGDPTNPGPWMDRVNGCQAVVGLVGEGIFNHRWSESFKAVLHDSRIKSTENTVAAIRQAADKPTVFIHGTAVGYYGFHADAELTEASPPADDFLGRMCVEWERAAQPAAEMGVRLVMLRTGVVLDRAGGALAKMLLPFRLFVGGPVGSGRQWISWIHHADEVGLILWALDNAHVRGPLNAAAPHPVTNRELSKAIGAAMSRPSFFPTPGFVLRLALGEQACLVLEGQKVLPRRALESGYAFKFPDIEAALRDLFSTLAAAKLPA